MKKFFIVALASGCCFLFSCNLHSDSGTTSGGDSTASKNLAATHDIYKGIETGDMGKFSSIPADAIDHQGTNGHEVKGGDSVKHALADLHNHLKDLKIDVMQEAANGDYVFVLSKLSGTTSDNSIGMPPGTPFSQTGVDVIRFKDGMAEEHWGYVDPNEMMKMMQSMQQPPSNMKMDSSKKK